MSAVSLSLFDDDGGLGQLPIDCWETGSCGGSGGSGGTTSGPSWNTNWFPTPSVPWSGYAGGNQPPIVAPLPIPQTQQLVPAAVPQTLSLSRNPGAAQVLQTAQNAAANAQTNDDADDDDGIDIPDNVLLIGGAALLGILLLT